MDESVKREFLSKFDFGDMQIRYYEETERGHVVFALVPTHMENEIQEYKFSRGDSMVQCKILGDVYPASYVGGVTMHNCGTTEEHFVYDCQKVREDETEVEICTYFRDKRGYEMCHRVNWHRGDEYFECCVSFANQSQREVTLENLTSFCINEITPFQAGDAANSMILHRIRSKWSQEGRLVSERIEDLQLEPSWCLWSPHAERFGQLGSQPVRKYFPFMAVEDTKAHVVWGVQLAHEASWQMELYRRDDALVMDGGLADREFGHWMKTVQPGETFVTPAAIVSVLQGSVDLLCQRLASASKRFVEAGPESEQELPILFNEYCTTWGLPSHENIKRILEAVKDKPIRYFVVDCGWFVEEGVDWSVSMGDYVPSDQLFPNGMKYTADMIRSYGMKPGIWFEIDNVGHRSHAFTDHEDHLLKRDGYTLTTQTRRFWDMRDPWVQEHLGRLVIGRLKECGFEYMKMDYNETIGIGCDGAESVGEGLRQNVEASLSFVERVKKEVPGIILENCASGGHKLEPRMMRMCSMASFSDAHECEEIPVIAANLHRCILPSQSQIWAVIRKDYDLKRIAYIMASTFLGRMCLSGDVTELNDEQWHEIDEAMSFYMQVCSVIKDGTTYFHGEKFPSDRHPQGWQGIARKGGKNGEALVVVHTFAGPVPDEIQIKLPEKCGNHIESIYSFREEVIGLKDGVLTIQHPCEWEGIGIYLI